MATVAVAADGEPAPLYATGITSAEINALSAAAHENSHNVVAVMLSSDTTAETLRYYLVLARNALEADIRATRSDILGSQDADSSVSVGLSTHFHDEQKRGYDHSSRAEAAHRESSGGGGGGGYDMMTDMFDDESEESSSPLRPLNQTEKGTLREVGRVQDHISLIEGLAHVVVGENVDSYDMLVARLVFFNALNASRRLKQVVMRSEHAERLPVHVAMPRDRGVSFFPVLNAVVEAYYMYRFESAEQFLRELHCYYHTGMQLAAVVEMEARMAANTEETQ